MTRLICIFLALLLMASAASSDGFHSPLLRNSDPHTWADGVRTSLGIDRSESAEAGTAERTVPAARVNQLVNVLKYLRSKNVLLKEFPNFNYKNIPGFLSETESLLIAIGKDAVPLLVATLVQDLTYRVPDGTLERNSDFQERLIRILIAIGEDSLDEVMEAAGTGNSKVRAAMLRIIKGVAAPADFGDDLEKWTKWYRIWKAGKRRSSGAVPALLANLADQDARIRIAAVRALGLIRSRKAVPGLRSCLMGDPDETIRREAIRALVRIGDLSVVPDLILLLDSPRPAMREEAVTGLRFLSRLSFGYDPRASAADRTEAAGNWLEWWGKVRPK